MNRLPLLALLTLALGLPAGAQVRLNGKSIIHDALANQYVCTVPDSCFGGHYSAVVTIEPGSAWSRVEIDGKAVADGEKVRFYNLDGTTAHSLRAQAGDSGIEATLLFSCLPLLEVNAAPLSAAYCRGTFVLHHPDSVSPTPLQGRVKWRGRTTLMASRNKRNFHIKLEDEQGQKLNRKLLGMRDDNSWLLDGGQTDMARIRNHVAHELWLDMAAKPYYADREPKARSAVRGELVELFVNGRYEGIYTLSEAMDRKQLRLARYDTGDDGAHTIHGQLWKAVTYGKGTLFTGTTEPSGTRESWNGFDMKYPELDEVAPADYQTLYDAVDFVATAYDKKFRSEAQDYFDLPVVRDYMIFLQVLLAIDNTAKNICWAVYDKQQDKRLTLAVWDLDCTVGQDWTNTPFRPEERVGPERQFGVGSNLFGRLNVLYDGFHDDLVERYRELRKTVLHTDSLTLRYTRLIDHLMHSGAAQRECVRWNGDSDLGGRDLDWPGERAYISDWIARRLRFLDANTYAPAAVEDVPAPAATPRRPAGTYDLTGRKMPEGDLPPGLYVRDGKKIIVR